MAAKSTPTPAWQRTGESSTTARGAGRATSRGRSSRVVAPGLAAAEQSLRAAAGRRRGLPASGHSQDDLLRRDPDRVRTSEAGSAEPGTSAGRAVLPGEPLSRGNSSMYSEVIMNKARHLRRPDPDRGGLPRRAAVRGGDPAGAAHAAARPGGSGPSGRPSRRRPPRVTHATHGRPLAARSDDDGYIPAVRQGAPVAVYRYDGQGGYFERTASTARGSSSARGPTRGGGGGSSTTI